MHLQMLKSDPLEQASMSFLCSFSMVKKKLTKAWKKRLFTSIQDGNLKLVKSLLSENPDAIGCLGEHNAYCRDKTPLMFAIQYRKFEIANWLIDAGANVNFKMPAGPKTPVLNYVALPFAPIELLEKMLEAGSDPNQYDGRGSTALHEVIRNVGKNREKSGLAKIVLLQKFGADFDIVHPSEEADVQPRSARELAVFFEEYLPRGIAEIFGLPKTVKNSTQSEMVQKQVTKAWKRQLFASIQDGNLKLVKSLLSENPDAIECLGEHNSYCRDKTPLMYAFQNWYSEIASWLIDRGAGVNFRMPEGPKTPVLNYAAAPAIPIELLEKMLNAGSDPNLHDVRGETALHVVIEKTAKELEKNGTDKILLLAAHDADFDKVGESEDPFVEPCSPRELAVFFEEDLPSGIAEIFGLPKAAKNSTQPVQTNSNIILEHPDDEFDDYKSALVNGFSKIDLSKCDRWFYVGVQGGTESTIKEDVFAIKGRQFLFSFEQLHKRRQNKSYIAWFAKIEKDADGFCLLSTDVTPQQLAELVDYICTKITKLPKFQGDYAIGFEYWPDFDYEAFKQSINAEE